MTATVTSLTDALHLSVQRRVRELRAAAAAEYTVAADLETLAGQHAEAGSRLDYEADVLANRLDEANPA